jgi:cysteine synthase A
MIHTSSEKSISKPRLAGSVLKTIGETPLVHLSRISKCANISAYRKMEMMNPGGSIKDRTALAIIERGLADGNITAETTIVESSSGNMAIGLAQACLYYNLPLIIVVDPKANLQTLKILKAYGAKLDEVKKPLKDGGFLGARIKRVKELMAEQPNFFWTNQYSNEANPEAHYQTMTEISNALNDQVDYLFVATSTCGTLMGCADYINENNLNTKLIAVDAVGSVTFGQTSERRLIPGHGAGLPSQFLNKGVVDKVMHVNDRECVKGCKLLLKKEGIMAGGSSGAVISAFLKIAPELREGSKAVVILCDRGERYLETIYNPDWCEKNFNKQDL